MDAQAPPSQQEVPAGASDIVGTFVQSVVGFLSSYGWSVTFGVVFAIILWSNVEPKFRKWRNRMENDKISAQMHKDPDALLRQHEGMLMARRKLQETHDKEAEVHKEKVSEREEQKRNEKIADWERHLEGKGYRSKVSNATHEENTGGNKKPKKQRLLQNDFNHLMGGAGSSGYRPSRRSGGATGG